MPIRVLIVDDSAFLRYTVTKHLETDPEIEVVGNAQDGSQAIKQLLRLKPDVVVLDVEMPGMDGLTALKQIIRQQPTPTIMLSALTQPGTRTTIQALMRGAVDFVAKPQANQNVETVMKELRLKIKVAAKAFIGSGPPPATEPLLQRSIAKKGPQLFQKNDPLIIMATSTGGPRTLQQILSTLPASLPAALMIVQHMPAGFTKSLAQRLHNHSPLLVQEAAQGDRLALGLALLAPGNFHLCLQNMRQVRLDEGPRRQHVRPAADVTMESVVTYHGPNIIAVILTGMGRDGTAGARQVKAAGGQVIAEHESSSVVHGMPASVIEAGLADQIVPRSKIAATLRQLIGYG